MGDFSKKIAVLVMMGISGICATGNDTVFRETKVSCISLYKNGEYENAMDCLKLLIPYAHTVKDSVVIFKFMGFCNGMLGKIDQAKENFISVLNKLPDLQIDTLEVPPNISIIFNQVKLEQKTPKVDTVTVVKRVEVSQKKSPFIPVMLLAIAVASAGAGGYYYYSGNTLRDKYRALDTPNQVLMDKSYNDFKNAYIKSAVCFGVSAVLLPVSTYLFLHKGQASKHIGMSNLYGVPSFVYYF